MLKSIGQPRTLDPLKSTCFTRFTLCGKQGKQEKKHVFSVFSQKYQTHLHFFPINSPAFFKQSRLLSKLNPFGAAQLPALSWS